MCKIHVRQFVNDDAKSNYITMNLRGNVTRKISVTIQNSVFCLYSCLLSKSENIKILSRFRGDNRWNMD
jgi:hypothetical protein